MSFTGKSAFGTDLARFQGQKVPFDDLVDKGCRFFYTKATHGELVVDPTFWTHWADLAELLARRVQRLRRAPYMWLDPGDAVLQVEALARVLDRVQWDPSADWQPAIDFEDPRFTPDMARRSIEMAVSRGITLFGKVTIYTGRWFWRENVGDSDSELCASCALWFAQYPKPWKGLPTDYVDAVRALPPPAERPLPWQIRNIDPIVYQFDGNGGLKLPNGVDADFDCLRDDCDLETLVVRRTPTTLPAPPDVA
jgi:GH25 family lysozyme M1 (1,4-beta-N-acetylmuramidase)